MSSTISTSPSQKQEIYRVPTRFGLSAMLVVLTLFAIVFAVLRSLDASPMLYLFIASLAVITGVMQMRMGDVPRFASAVAGALFLPVWFVGALAMAGLRTNEFLFALLALPFVVPAGAIVGYFSGTLMAGVFLTIDLTEKWIADRRAAQRQS